MSSMADDLERLAREQDFWGVVRVDRDGETELAMAFGLADRSHGIAHTVDTRIGVASGNKTLTALAVMQLVDAGRLGLDTPARDVLGDDLPLIADDVTIEHLLTHTSGIGDYLDEDAGIDLRSYLMPVASQYLATSDDFLAVLGGHPTKFPAGSRFTYCNGAYVVLAIIAERVSGTPFHELVEQQVCGAAGMSCTAFLRSDELPGDAAIGYVDVAGTRRSNVFHLPVRGTGDGGIFTTAADMVSFWSALYAGSIVPVDIVAEMTRPHATEEDTAKRYGLGLWLHPTSEVVFLEGCDSGASFRSVHDPMRDLTHTVLSNTTDGAWDVTDLLAAHLGTAWS